MYIGIDAGGTHTDLVLVDRAFTCCDVKVPTVHHDFLSSIKSGLAALREKARPEDMAAVKRVTLGTTLAINALIQHKADKVGLMLTAGPGINPIRFGMGEYVYVVPGGLDHRGVEVTPLDVATVATVAQEWAAQNVTNFAVVGKFSPRNSAHEEAIANILRNFGTVSMGHELSAELNFPRRVAGAFFSAAVQKVYNQFLEAVEKAVFEIGIDAPIFLLKADGGAIPLAQSRCFPLYSILSGPAASAMGLMALTSIVSGSLPHSTLEPVAINRPVWKHTDDCILLDMGGTTTDIALFAQGLPILDRDGMSLAFAGQWYKTQVRALATVSVGVGGDSCLSVEQDTHVLRVQVGPQREGAAMAFGGMQPTLLDALNVLADAIEQMQIPEQEYTVSCVGAVEASLEGMACLAKKHNTDMLTLAHEAAYNACTQVQQAIEMLLKKVHTQPVYTLAELLEGHVLQPTCAWLVGGPAQLMRPWFAQALCMPVHIPSNAHVANAIGAALTLPTDSVELFADTAQGFWSIPTTGQRGSINKSFSLQEAKSVAVQALRTQREKNIVHSIEISAENNQAIDIVTAECFATLDAYGHGGKDMRVRCQWRPGIVSSL